MPTTAAHAPVQQAPRRFTNILVNEVLATQSISRAYEEFICCSAAASSDAALANVSLDVKLLNTGSNAAQYATIALDNSSPTNPVLTGSRATGMSITMFSIPGSVPTCSF